jgi:hypothetical protein
MASTVRVPGFLPSTSGFHFGNSWPHQPTLTIPFPTGPINVGDAAGGLCGGMAFAARDFFESGEPIPATTTNPPAHTPLYDYLVRRLFDSFDIPAGVAKFYTLQLPFTDQAGETVRQWQRIQPELDAGRLVCLGLIRVRSFSPGALGRNHQVLTYGYDEQDGRVTLAICDPNHHDADDVTLSFSTGGAPEVQYAVGGAVVAADSHEHTYGAFVQRYLHCTPSAALDAPPIPDPPTDEPSTA